MFADGLRDFEAAEVWSWRAIALADNWKEARDVVGRQSYYALTAALLRNDFARAGKVFCLSAKTAAASIEQVHISATIPEQNQLDQELLSSSREAIVSLSKVATAIPITFRLATRIQQGASTEEITTAIAAVESGIEPVPEATGLAAGLRRSFVEDTDWRTLAEEAIVAHDTIDYVKSQTLMVGAILKAPPSQSLHLQVKLMRNLAGLFSARSSLYNAIIAPFLVEYFKTQASRTVHPFRTAQAYTLRQLELSDGSVAGTRRLLSAMRFCMGITLPPDEMAWLDQGENKI